VVWALIAFSLSVIFNRSRKNLDFGQLIRVENVTKSGFDLCIDNNWIANNPLTLFSLNEELAGWNQFGYNIKLVNK
jgi:hypothetical protein